MKKLISFSILLCFFVSGIMGPCPVHAQEFSLPVPGNMVALSSAYSPAVLKGIKLDPKDPFLIDFFVDRGDPKSPLPLKEEAVKLIKYFFASLTIPEKDLWVNLSPYEKDRIVPKEFGQTEMGRDLLAEDYILKQITASLVYPEGKLGGEFWQKIYAQAKARYGTTNVSVNTFNKVWIVPEKAVVYENNGTAFVLENHLKVMLEEDYLSMQKHANVGEGLKPSPTGVNQLGSKIVREIVLPALEREVNEGKNFAPLRQVFYSLILATWYKKKIKDSILNKIYSDQKKIDGVQYMTTVVPSPEGIARFRGDKDKQDDAELIYQRYLQAFKKGVYNYIKEDHDSLNNQTTPRKYFSGGVAAQGISGATIAQGRISNAQLAALAQRPIYQFKTSLAMITPRIREGIKSGTYLFIALVLGALIVGGVYKIFYNKQNNRLPNSVSHKVVGVNVTNAVSPQASAFPENWDNDKIIMHQRIRLAADGESTPSELSDLTTNIIADIQSLMNVLGNVKPFDYVTSDKLNAKLRWDVTIGMLIAMNPSTSPERRKMDFEAFQALTNRGIIIDFETMDNVVTTPYYFDRYFGSEDDFKGFSNPFYTETFLAWEEAARVLSGLPVNIDQNPFVSQEDIEKMLGETAYTVNGSYDDLWEVSIQPYLNLREDTIKKMWNAPRLNALELQEIRRNIASTKPLTREFFMKLIRNDDLLYPADASVKYALTKNRFLPSDLAIELLARNYVSFQHGELVDPDLSIILKGLVIDGLKGADFDPAVGNPTFWGKGPDGTVYLIKQPTHQDILKRTLRPVARDQFSSLEPNERHERVETIIQHLIEAGIVEAQPDTNKVRLIPPVDFKAMGEKFQSIAGNKADEIFDILTEQTDEHPFNAIRNRIVRRFESLVNPHYPRGSFASTPLGEYVLASLKEWHKKHPEPPNQEDIDKALRLYRSEQELFSHLPEKFIFPQQPIGILDADINAAIDKAKKQIEQMRLLRKSLDPKSYDLIKKPAVGLRPSNATRDPGGIDLNPSQMRMQVKKGQGDFKFDFKGVPIDASRVRGVTFTFLQVEEVVNLSSILGLTKP